MFRAPAGSLFPHLLSCNKSLAAYTKNDEFTTKFPTIANVNI